ncbi:MAG: glycosyltransferase family 9 protein, partial [Candidatus Binatia bacterium]
GQHEIAFAQEVSEMVGGTVTNLSGKTSLRDLIGVFNRARLALGPDSGPMHIAAATGTPVISLWGATSPLRSAPWGSAELVLRGPAACSPCYVRRCRIGRVCMQRITPEQVLEIARRVLSQGVRGRGPGASEEKNIGSNHNETPTPDP